MNTRTIRTTPLLSLAAACALLAACGGDKNMTPADEMGAAFDDFSAEIREVVTDEARADQVVAIIEQLEVDLRLMQNRINARQGDFRKLNANYDATMEDFQRFSDRVERETRENRDKAATSYRELYRLLTPEERDALVKTRSKAVTAAIANLDAA